jgi:hypothetical protein
MSCETAYDALQTGIRYQRLTDLFASLRLRLPTADRNAHAMYRKPAGSGALRQGQSPTAWRHNAESGDAQNVKHTPLT